VPVVWCVGVKRSKALNLFFFCKNRSTPNDFGDGLNRLHSCTHTHTKNTRIQNNHAYKTITHTKHTRTASAAQPDAVGKRRA
jgi:hypothetical protein